MGDELYNSDAERRWFCSFLPHDAMRKRGLCCRPVSVHLSVCLSAVLYHVGALYPDGWR